LRDLGYRTLVVSTDIAHSLADSLDVPLHAQPMEIAPNLFAQEINVVEEVREHWGEMQGYLGNVLRKQGMNKAVSEEMAIIPGMEEVVSLLHINKQAREGHFDCVIVDAAPTGETMRLLTMPESFQWYVGRLRSWGDATLKLASGLLTRIVPDKDLFTGLNKLVERRQGVADSADRPDGNQLSHRAQPREDGAQGRRARRHLSLALWLPGGRRHRQPHPAGCGRATASVAPASSAEQRQLSAPLAGDPGALPGRDRTRLLPAPDPALALVRPGNGRVEPVAPAGRRPLPGARPQPVFFRGQAQSIEEEGEDFVLRLPLPQVELEKVKLTKRGDELFVNIGNFKRELLLPSVLAQRDASGASFTDGVLKIRFPPPEGAPAMV
jgi:arsenite-transporting ATPase